MGSTIIAKLCSGGPCNICCPALTILSFIIANLAYIGSNSPCILALYPNQPFTLQTWLIVDTIKSALLLLIFCILGCRFLSNQNICFALFLTYTLFATLWFILGSIIFWDKLQYYRASCSSGISTYMFFNLIFTLIFVIILIVYVVFYSCTLWRNS